MLLTDPMSSNQGMDQGPSSFAIRCALLLAPRNYLKASGRWPSGKSEQVFASSDQSGCACESNKMEHFNFRGHNLKSLPRGGRQTSEPCQWWPANRMPGPLSLTWGEVVEPQLVTCTPAGSQVELQLMLLKGEYAVLWLTTRSRARVG